VSAAAAARAREWTASPVALEMAAAQYPFMFGMLQPAMGAEASQFDAGPARTDNARTRSRLARPAVVGLLTFCCLLAGQPALAQPRAACALDGGVLATPQASSVVVPAGCTITFKAWGGGGGGAFTYSTNSPRMAGGGGGFASISRTSSAAALYTLAVGGAGQQSDSNARASGGSGVQGFQGGAGGNGSQGSAAGGGGGGASVVWVGLAEGTPLLVAAGGGGAGTSPVGDDGHAAGLGPFGVSPAGMDGSSEPDGGGGAGGGGAGYPLGGAGGKRFGEGGGGGQNFVLVGGITAFGSGRSPGNAGDPARPPRAGEGGLADTGSKSVDGAIVYSIHASRTDFTPDDLEFEELVDQELDALVTSATLVVSGFDSPTTVSAVGPGEPELSVEGRPWSTEDIVAPGDRLQLRQRTSPQPRTTRAALLLLGMTTEEWRVTTGGDREPLAVGCGCRAVESASPSLTLALTMSFLGARLRRRRARTRGRADPGCGSGRRAQ
jgi:hypothetical protein